MDFFGTLALIILIWKSRTTLFFMMAISLVRLATFGFSVNKGYSMFTLEYINSLARELYALYGMNAPVEVRNIKTLKRDTGVYDINPNKSTAYNEPILATLGGDYDGDSISPTHIVYIKFSETNPLRWLWSLYRDAYILYSLVDDVKETRKQNPSIFNMDNKFRLHPKKILKILFLGKY